MVTSFYHKMLPNLITFCKTRKKKLVHSLALALTLTITSLVPRPPLPHQTTSTLYDLTNSSMMNYECLIWCLLDCEYRDITGNRSKQGELKHTIVNIVLESDPRMLRVGIVLTRTINKTTILILVTQCAEHHDNSVVLGNDPQMTVNA